MKQTTIQILSEDVKKLVKQISSYEEQGMTFFAANEKAIDEILPNYDFFWQLVILAAICRRCVQVDNARLGGNDKTFIDIYLKNKNHEDLCKRIIKDLTRKDNKVGTEVDFTRDDWNNETEKLMDELLKTDDTFRYDGIVDARQIMFGF
jgi:hypothetical protein